MDGTSSSVDVARSLGRELARTIHGPPDAPAILFLHGITGSRHYWEPVLEHLGDQFRLVLPDLLGFGQSPKPPVRYSVATHAAALQGFLEDVGLAERPIQVVAHSLGALITLEHAVSRPGLVQRAMLFSVPCHGDRVEAHEHFVAGSPNYRRLVGAHSLGATLTSWTSAGAAMGLRYLFAFSPKIARDSKSWTLRSLTSTIQHSLLEHRVQDVADRVAALPEGRRPELLLVHGSRDQVTPASRVRELQRRLPETALHVLEMTGHHPFRTHEAFCIEQMQAFLAPEPDPRIHAVAKLDPA